MESAATFGVVLAAMFFSVACALMLEELIFGGLFHFFFAPRTESVRQRVPGRKA
ncbi:MAG TPA: hypothetical protein VMU28_05485 [Terriglobales bacterium]|nr:hypothetical protein [Terriglobales bacterium]